MAKDILENGREDSKDLKANEQHASSSAVLSLNHNKTTERPEDVGSSFRSFIRPLRRKGEQDKPTPSLEEILKQKIYTKVTVAVLKLRIDPDEILSDAIAFYKRSDFDPSGPIRVHFNDQPAIDSGGLKRQFFNDLFEKFATSPELKLFEGPPTRLLFSYNQQTLSSGIAKLFGVIVAYCIGVIVAQGSGGFPYLAESSYYYLATGGITQAMDLYII